MSLRSRLISVLVILVLFSGVLFASTLPMSHPEAEGAEGSSWLNRTETIYFWYSDEALTDYVNRAAVQFGQKESVHVLPVLTESSRLLDRINQASVEGEQFPDVYLLSNELLEKAYLSGLASEIRDGQGICESGNFGDGALSAVTYKNKKVGYPFSFETSALVYNRTYLELWAAQMALSDLTTIDAVLDEDGNVITEETTIPEEEVDPAELEKLTAEYLARAVPQTLSDLLNIADTFDAPEGVECVMTWDVSDILYNYWIVGDVISMGGDTGDDRTNISLNNDGAVSCLTEYQNLQTFFSIESDSITYESSVDDFLAGKSVFTVGTTDVVAKIRRAAEDGLLTFEYGIATMPEVGETYDSRSLSVTQVAVINGYSEHKDIANAFAQYLVTDCAEDLYERTGVPSANRNTEADDPYMSAFAREYEDSVPLPKMMETENFWMQMEVLFAKVWNGADVTEELRNLEQTTQILLGEAN